MTWQLVTLILGILAFLGWESYVNILKGRTEVAERSLRIGITAEQEAAEEARAALRAFGNGDS